LELTRLKGFQDLIGAQVEAVATVEQHARRLMERYAVAEIRIPLLERVELYQHSTGETSDVVTKQMYTFSDRDEEGTTLALRPEGTPGVVRAYIEAGLDRSEPEQRFFYSGPMFRRERPQKGRYRQFQQFGVEIFGRADAAADAELLMMVDDLRRELGLELDFEVNSLGCQQCRPQFRAALLQWGRSHLDQLCRDCHERLERNPLRLLDCKIDVELTKSAPHSLDYLCEECRRHFDLFGRLLSSAGVRFTINPQIVRGLDYYVRTTFEVYSRQVGAQSAVMAGGRYDGLVASLGGAPIPGTGFAIGVDRLALALQASGLPRPALVKVALLTLGEAALERAVAIARDLRNSAPPRPLQVEVLSPGRSLKSQLKRANNLGFHFALIIGDNELARGVVMLRDLERSTQHEVSIDALPAALDGAAL
jgi:histidyl-tRNA synthetase